MMTYVHLTIQVAIAWRKKSCRLEIDREYIVEQKKMSKEHHVNFNDLLNLTFNGESLHIKHLQLLFKSLVAQLKLNDVELSVSDQNLLLKEYDVIQVTKDENDVKEHPVIATTSKPKTLCQKESFPKFLAVAKARRT